VTCVKNFDIPYRLVIAAAKTWFKVGGVPIDMQGTEHIPAEGGAVIACNHNSYFDFIMTGYPGEKNKRFTRFMAKREIFDHPVGGPVMRSFHHLSVDRASGAGSLRVAIQACKDGEAVGIYPEATTSRSFLIKGLKSGATRIASGAGVPVIPVVHFGMHRYHTKDHPRDLSRGKPVVIRVGEPFYPDGADPSADTAELKARMEALLEECIAAYPDKEPGAWWLPHTHGGTAPTIEEAEVLEKEEKRQRAERKAAKRAKKG
jgi:1-acyl-sn-glycerol-3-phosphate acyltransferase